MSGKYIKNIYRLFEKYDFYCNSFYVDKYSHQCLFVGCTHSSTGFHILVFIPADLEIVFDKTTMHEHAKTIILVEYEQDPDPETDTTSSISVAQTYSQDTDQQVDITGNPNLDEALVEDYKHFSHPDKQNRLFKYNMMDIKRQLERLRYIISPITYYGLAIENRDILVYTELHSNTIRTLKMDKVPKETRILYIIISMDIFYDKRRNVVDIIQTIHRNILQVLDHNFNKQIRIIKLLLSKCQDSINTIDSIHATQEDHENEYKELPPVTRIEDVVKRVDLLGKINCIGLCIDKIMFDNIVSYNNIVNNYELLIKLDLLPS